MNKYSRRQFLKDCGKAAAVAGLSPAALAGEDPSEVFDVVVYGGTSAGVIAAVQAARMDRSVILVSPDRHPGGLTSGGLGWTDTGNQSAIGGLSREFYQRLHDYYEKSSAWKYEKPQELNADRGHGTFDPDADAIWVFEPHVAERIYEQMLDEAGVPVVRDAWLDRDNGVRMQGNRIASITTLDGRTWRGRTFIDATYEGDLMAAAGVTFTVGRESNDTYDELWNGVQRDARHHGHYFKKEISPYVDPDDPSSGLVPRVHGGDPGDNGEGDHRVQAYCFRMCMTKVPENRVPWPKPDGYDEREYELLLRNFEAGDHRLPLKIDMMPNRKTDTNNHGAFSTDNIGKNYDYPTAGYAQRRRIVAAHERYQKGLMWTLANHPRVPEHIRQEVSEWGMAADEFTDNGNWPHQLYIREARRMVGNYVMTEHDCRRTADTPKPVGLGSYTMDSHNVQRYVTEKGHVQNEGDIGVHPGGPYEISYDSLVPKEEECANLLVPVCVSSSHIAYGSIRMEPVFMILGQSAATGAVHAIEERGPVQRVDYGRLKKQLLADGQHIETDAAPKVPPVQVRHLEGVVVDDNEAERKGTWEASTSVAPFVGDHYRHDGNEDKADKAALYSANLDEGRYEVRMSYTAHGNRATNVPVLIHHADGTTTVHVNEQKTPEHDDLFTTLGEFRFTGDKPAGVEIKAEGTDGHVIIDAVQWLSVE